MAAEPVWKPSARRLGEYLACDPAGLASALEIQARAPAQHRRRVGELLLEAEAIRMDELLAALQAQRVDRLRACSLFASLSDGELTELAVVFQEVTIPGHREFIQQDERDSSLFVLASGSLKVFRTDDDGSVTPLARVFPGEPVGEMGYFAKGVRSASVTTLEVSELLRSRYDDLSDCFERYPQVAAAFMETITRRLRHTNVLFQENQYRSLPAVRRLGHLDDFIHLPEAGQLESSGEQLLVRMVHSASRITDADRASLFLIDPSTGELWSKVAEGPGIREIRVPGGAGIVGWVVDHNETLNVEDAYEDARFNPEVDRHTGYRTRTILCTPLRGEGGRIIGAVQVINKQLGVFTEEDESLLRGFAAQAAIAVENIHLFQGVARGYRRLALLLEVATTAARARSLGDLAARVGERLPELLDCARVELLVLDEASGELRTTPATGEPTLERRYPLGSGLAGHALFTGETVNVPDVFDDPRYDLANDAAPGRRTRCVLCTPVREHGQSPVGVLQATDRRDGVFADDDAEILRAIAAQLATSALWRNGDCAQ